MPDLRDYILSTFNYCIDLDSIQLSQYCTLSLLDEGEYNVYITPIKNPNFSYNQDKYNSLIEQAFNVWTDALFEAKIKFNIINTPYQADIKVYWTKANKFFAGMQFQEENLNYKKRSLTVGIAEIDWEPYTEDEVYHIALHEVGHVFGLGHSKNKNDIMSSCGNWATELSQNDLKVLNLIYSIGKHKSYSECVDYINHYFLHWDEKTSKQQNVQNKNLQDILLNIGYVKLFNLLQPNVVIPKQLILSNNIYNDTSLSL